MYGVASAIALMAVASGASAAATIGAVSISSPQGDLGGIFSLANIIDQSSLSATYVSGVTDFGTFTASTTGGGLAGAGYTGTSSSGPQQFTFDLGSLFSIDAISIWNSGSAGSITRFELYADNDNNFANGTSALILGPSALAFGPTNPDIFRFAQCPDALHTLQWVGQFIF